MERHEVRFEPDPSLEGIEVIVRAKAMDQEVRALMDRLSDPLPNVIQVYDERGMEARMVSASDIVSASMEGKLVRVITTDGCWYARRTLQSLESALSPERFVRISRYELVNLDKVLRYDFTITGTLRLELTGGMETWASRRCIPEIRKRLMKRRG